MTTTLNAVTSTGLVQTSDGSGVIKVQSNGVTTNALAWVKFAGSTGTIAASYNVSSITRISTGKYTVNFTNSTTDANYAPVLSATGIYNGTVFEISDTSGGDGTNGQTTSLFSFACRYNGASTTADPLAVFSAVFGN